MRLVYYSRNLFFLGEAKFYRPHDKFFRPRDKFFRPRDKFFRPRDKFFRPLDKSPRDTCHMTINKFHLDLFEDLVEGGILWAEGTSVKVDSSLVQKKSEFVILRF